MKTFLLSVILVFLSLSTAAESVLAPVQEKEAAMIQGRADDVPIGVFLREAVGEDRRVLFVTPSDARYRVVFEGPMWVEEAIQDMLAQAGLDAFWLGSDLIVYGDRKPYVVGHTARTSRAAGDTHFILPPSSVTDAFTMLAAEHGQFPMVSDSVTELSLYLTKPMRFSGLSMDQDIASFLDLLTAATQRIPFQAYHNNDVAVLELGGEGVPKPVMDARAECLANLNPDKNYAAIEADHQRCIQGDVRVTDRSRERTMPPPLTDGFHVW